MAPLAQALSENGSANLFGTCGSNASIGFVELEAGRFEVEAAEIKQPRDVAFQVVDQIFMLDA